MPSTTVATRAARSAAATPATRRSLTFPRSGSWWAGPPAWPGASCDVGGTSAGIDELTPSASAVSSGGSVSASNAPTITPTTMPQRAVWVRKAAVAMAGSSASSAAPSTHAILGGSR